MKVLVLGERGGLGAALMRSLEQAQIEAEAALSLSDSEVAGILKRGRWRAVVVVARDDVLSLRLTLLSAHLRPDVPLWVTMFDRTIARELHHVVPAVHLISPSELAASELAEHCIAVAGPTASRGHSGIRLVDDALRLLVIAGAGLLARASLRWRHRHDRAARGGRRRSLLQHAVGRHRGRRSRRDDRECLVQGPLGAGHARGAPARGGLHGGARAPPQPAPPDDAPRQARGAGARPRAARRLRTGRIPPRARAPRAGRRCARRRARPGGALHPACARGGHPRRDRPRRRPRDARACSGFAAAQLSPPSPRPTS